MAQSSIDDYCEECGLPLDECICVGLDDFGSESYDD